MVRGLKKKLLIGLLSATVVGTSLAPSVPLVGSFAQEVKATNATNKYEYTEVTVSAVPATYKWKQTGTFYTVTENSSVTLSEGSATSGSPEVGDYYKEDDSGNYNKVKLIQDEGVWKVEGGAAAGGTYYKVTATEYTGTPTSGTATVDNVYTESADGSYTKTKLEAEVATYKWNVDYVPGKYFVSSTSDPINDENAKDAKEEFVKEPSGTFKVYTRKSAVKDQASVNIIDKKETSDVKVGNATISQPNKPSATVTVNGESGASTLVATNVKTWLNIV